MIGLLILLISLVLLIIKWINGKYKFWSDRGFTSPTPSFPFGNLSGVGYKIHSAEALDVFYKKYKGKNDFIGIYFFLSPVVLPISPELLKNILIKDFQNFHDRGFYYNKKVDPLSANLLTLESQEWREKRVKLTPIFTSGKMKMMFGIVDEIGDKLVRTIKKDSETTFEMGKLMAKYTMDVIGNIAFGMDCNCLENPDSEFLSHGRNIFELGAFDVAKFFFTLAFPKFSEKLGLRMFKKEPADFFLEVFLTTLKEREERGDIKRNDFVQLLLQMKHDNNDKALTDVELAAESFIFFAGGFETSSTLLKFCLYELSVNLVVQDKLRSELQNFVDNNDGKITYDLLNNMEYLDIVVNETLRMYPPIATTIRVCENDYKIPGSDLVLPKGVKVEIPIFSLQRDPEYYPDPEKFDPERFTAENIKTRPAISFIPFGEGPRNCIGLRFGLMQTKIAIAKLLLDFELSLNEKTITPIKFAVSSPVLSPQSDMWIDLKSLL